jgi:hypothetical protein
MVTFKTIIKDIEEFCDSHLQINEFGWGPISEISTKNHDFVMCWLLPTSATKNKISTIIDFDMYVFDLLKQDGSNKLDVINDTFLIGKDIISNFYYYDYEFEIDEVSSAEPFDFKFDDLCGGWIFKIKIEYQDALNDCEIPN